jgi:outer membrane protein, heavy metal efflux system
LKKPYLIIVVNLSIAVGLCFANPSLADESKDLISRQESSLDGLINLALEQNPQIRSAHQKRDSAKAAILKAWDLKNPQASYEFMGEDVQTRIGPQEQKYGLMQTIPFPTKLPLRTKVAVIAEKIAAHYILHTRQMVRTQVIKAYADLLSAEKQLEILNSEKEVLNQISASIRASVATGHRTSSDAAKIESEIAKISEKTLKAKVLRIEAEQRLNVAIGRRNTTSWPALEKPDLPKLEFSLEKLKSLALQHRHGFLIKRLMLDQEDAKLALAQMDYLPDFEVGFSYIEIGDGTTSRPDDGQDAWSIPVKVSIPLWEPQLRGRVREAEHLKRAAQAELEYMENETVAAISEAYTRYETARDRVRVYETTWIPQARQAYSGNLAGFEGGNMSTLETLDSLRMNLEAQLGYWQSYADALGAHALVEQVIGFPLDQIGQVKSHEDLLKHEHIGN